jgi:hypothetical protein
MHKSFLQIKFRRKETEKYEREREWELNKETIKLLLSIAPIHRQLEDMLNNIKIKVWTFSMQS